MFEKFLHQTPFFRLVFALILGILFRVNVNISFLHCTFILFLLLFIILLFNLFGVTKDFKFNSLWGILISLFIFFVGIELVAIKNEKKLAYENMQHEFVANIIEQPEEKENSVKTILQLISIKDSVSWKSNSSKFIAYFEKDSSSLDLNLGDQIISKTYINEIKHSGNPFAFNYKKYLSHNEIYHQCYIESSSYNLIGKNKGSFLRLYSNKLRKKLLNIYVKNGLKDDDFAILAALTLGYKAELTPELKQSFSTSGAMHILAVSGLHVGIIFIILVKLLFFLEKNKYGKHVQSVIIILVLFFYAFLTGLSDSVFRATIMFTIISLGRMFTRQVNIYNSIAVSAFVLLIINPYSIMNVGFQLSYAAVLSIIFFQPKLYSILNINNKFLDYIWQLVSVSIAAQIGTFPITIFYFGLFPTYFIITNIIVIPVASIIIYLAFLLFILSFSGYIAHVLSLILHYITSFLNASIQFIEHLNFSKIEGILIDKIEILLLILVIVIISFFMITKRIKYLKISIVLTISLIIYNLSISHLNSKKSLFVVHYLNKTTGLHFIQNFSANLYTNDDLESNESELNYNVAPLWKNMEIINKNIDVQKLKRNVNYIKFQDKKIIQIQSDSIFSLKTKMRFNADYLVLSNDINITIDKLKQYFEFKLIIFDSSNSYYKIKEWKKQCIQNNIPYHSVLESGAFIANL